MRCILFSAAVIAGSVWGSSVPAMATQLVTSRLISANLETNSIEEVGWRRQYRRYGYPVPYVYYPPTYGYYAPPAYAYYPPAYDSYVPPPAVADGDYSSADGDYGDYPPANGEYGEYPPADAGIDSPP